MIKKGIGASPGVAIADAFVYVKQDVEIPTNEAKDVKEELKIFDEAVEKSKEQLAKIQETAADSLGEEEAAIFEAHALFLDDPDFVGVIRSEIEGNKKNAAKATQDQTDAMYTMFDAMDDAYFQARKADIKDVGARVINNILGIEEVDISNIPNDVVLFAIDLAPSDTAQMDKIHVKGFATDIGSRTSHTAIMARSLEIPAVLGLGDITALVKNGQKVIVDGSTGEVVIDPDAETLAKYQKQQEEYEQYQKELAQLKDLPAETTDGHRVELVGNIGSPNDVEGVLKNGGDGVGLYRTEFLYMDSPEIPDEETQFNAYKEVLEAFDGKPVVIRTLDIGGDKKLPYLQLEEEMNPFLGLRAIRLCFAEPELLKVQLRAILRASVYGQALIMFPMISGVGEVRQAKEILKGCMEELDKEGIKYDKEIKVGIMIEIPAAAVTADIIVPEVQFFSIGTNDLCQYTLAVDRMNEKISYLYNPFHPAILRLVKNVIQATDSEVGKFTGMCGEFAGDPYATLILMGLGLNEFSMSASSIPQVKKIVRSVSYEQAQKIANEALMLETGDDVRKFAEEEIKKLGIKIV